MLASPIASRPSSPSLSDVRAYLRDCVAIGTRSLAAFRILAGLLVIADLLLRSRNFHFFYTEDGVVPRSLAQELTAEYAVSVYHFTTDPTLIAMLFVVQGLVAVGLIVGYKTRLATILTFLLVVSLDHHNPFVLSYADTLFRLLLFWAIFLPLGERWSVDAVHRDRKPRETVVSVATALALVQVVYVYFTNGLTKTLSPEWVGGSAAPLVFGLDEVTFLFGDVLRSAPRLLELGGFLWFLMLLCSWLLIVLVGYRRVVLLGLFFAGHVSFALTVRIGAFPYVSILGLCLFVPTVIWRDGGLVVQQLAGVNGTLKGWRCRTIASAKRVPRLDVATLLGIAPHRIERSRSATHSLVLGIVTVTILLVSVVVLVQIGLVVADVEDEPVGESVDSALAEGLGDITGVHHVETVAESLGIDQPIAWGIFAEPRTEDRYYVFPALREDGETVDAFNDRALTYERPYDQLQQQHGTYRERFYMNSVRNGGATGNDVPVQLAEYVCEYWTDDDGAELTHVNMYMVAEEVTHETIDSPDDRDREYITMHKHGCDDRTPTVIDPPT